MAGVRDTATTDTAQLDQLVALAIERTYEAFSSRALGPSMTLRRPEVTPVEVSALGGAVRLVPASAMDRWLPHAISTWGSGDDLRALLPRVLELFASGALATPPEVLFTKIRQAGADTWSNEEQAAIEDLVTAVWLATLASDPPRAGHPAWRLLVAMAELGGDLSPFLDDWTLLLGTRAAEGHAARRHLRALTRRVEHMTGAGLGLGALFWSPSPRETERLEEWLAQRLTIDQAGP